MKKFNFKKINTETLHVEADLEEVFYAVRSRLVALGGKIKKNSLKEGILDAAWRYGVNFFGLHVTVQFRAIGGSKIEIHFSGGFKDAFDTTGAGREKTIAVMNDVMEYATPPEPTIKSVGNNTANLKSLSNAKFLKWFLLLNGALALTLIWTGPGALLIPVLGFGGALFSLVFAKWLAKKAHDIKTVDPLASTSKVEEQLHAIVANLAQRAGLPNTPEVGIYESPDMNAFATGINPRNALVAFSTRLLETMDHDQIQAVAAHEIAHVANRDMLGIVLLQGVTNSIVLLATLPLNALRIVNIFNRERSFLVEGLLWTIKSVAAVVLTFLGGLVVKAFSRGREYRADAYAATLLGTEPMISALKVLGADTAEIPLQQRMYTAFKVSGRTGLAEVFSTHPTIEKRIEALQAERFTRN